MTITRVWIEEGCISCGLSADNCPEVFKVKDEDSTVKGGGELFTLGGKDRESRRVLFR